MNPLALSRIGSLGGGRLPPRVALRRAADQFEGVFLRQLLRREEEGLLGDAGADALFGDSPAMRQYTELLHAALVEHNAGSLGIGRILAAQLGGGPATPSGGG